MKKFTLLIILISTVLAAGCGGNSGKRAADKQNDAATPETTIPEQAGFTIKQNPDVADDKVLEAILAEHKGKAVFVDFWATWCGPCIQAMKLIKPLKPEMADHGVVTIYISNPSSPEDQWRAMLPDIGGLHYYLTESQWKTVCDQHGIRGIPQYMIFDKSGNNTYQTAGFPGVDTMREELSKVW